MLERLVDRAAAQVLRDLVQREAVLRAERQHDRVVGGGRLELEVEGAAEALAQREPERAVQPPAVRRVHNELHAPGLVEEALDHETVERGHGTERGAAHREVVDEHRGRFRRDAGGVDQPRARAVRIVALEELVDALTQPRDLCRQLRGARRCLTHPERNGRRGVARVAARAPRRPRCDGSARSACRGGRCRPPSTRRPSPRSQFR